MRRMGRLRFRSACRSRSDDPTVVSHRLWALRQATRRREEESSRASASLPRTWHSITYTTEATDDLDTGRYLAPPMTRLRASKSNPSEQPSAPVNRVSEERVRELA